MRTIIITHTIFRDRNIMLIKTLWPLARRHFTFISFNPYNLTSQTYFKPTLSNVVDVKIVCDRDFGHILHDDLSNFSSSLFGRLCFQLLRLIFLCLLTICAHSFLLSFLLGLNQLALSAISLWLFNLNIFIFAAFHFFVFFSILCFVAVVSAPKQS